MFLNFLNQIWKISKQSFFDPLAHPMNQSTVSRRYSGNLSSLRPFQVQAGTMKDEGKLRDPGTTSKPSNDERSVDDCSENTESVVVVVAENEKLRKCERESDSVSESVCPASDAASAALRYCASYAALATGPVGRPLVPLARLRERTV